VPGRGLVCELLKEKWSGRRESNPRHQLGKLNLNECPYRWRKRARSYNMPTFAGEICS